MPDKDYNKAVYGKLKATYGDKLTISEDDFIKKLSSDEAYAKAAYGKLKDIYKDAFKAEEKDFLQEVKKKDNSQSNGGGTEDGTKPQSGQKPAKPKTAPMDFKPTPIDGVGKAVSGVQKAKSVGEEKAETIKPAPAKQQEGQGPKLTNFEKRIQNPVNKLQNEDGTTSTHKMMSWESDGKYFAAPTIVEVNGKLKELNPEEAIDYAFKNNEFKEFKTDAEAREYADNGYKKGTPLEKGIDRNTMFAGIEQAQQGAQEQLDLEAQITAPQTAPQKTAYNPMDIDSVNKKYGQLGGINKSVGDMAEPLPKSLQTTPIEDKIKIEKQKIVDKAIEKGITTEQYKEQNFDKAAAKYVPPYIKDEYETYKQIEKIKKDYAAYKAQGNEFQAEVSKTKLEAANQKLAIKKANTDRNIDSRISEINTLISEIKQGSNPGKFQDIEKLEQEAEDLKLQKQAFFNPLQATKSKIAEYGVKVDSWEQIKDYYAAIQSEYEDLLEKNPIAVGTVGRYTGEAERFVDLYNQVRTLAPIVLANRTPSNKDDSARSVFAKTAIQTAIPTTKGALQTQKQVADMINTSMEVAKINPSDINLPVAEALKKQATYENFSSKDWASMTGLTVGMMPHFALGGKVVGGLGKALNAEKALAQIVKNPKAYKWTKYVAGAVGTGLEYKAAGVLSPHLGDEATFASGFLGSALSKPAEKLFNAIGAKNVVQKVFKENAQGAVDIIEKVGKLVATGTGETLEEYGNEFGNLFAKYAETRDAQQLVKEIDERFGTVSKNFHFAVMSFVMGAGMGVGNAFGSYSTNEAKKAYNNLSEEEKGKFDEFVGDVNKDIKKATKSVQERDAEIKAAKEGREKLGIKDNIEVFNDVPETVTKTMDRFDNQLPLDKTAVEEASSYLYDKYKELEGMKSIEEGRTMTTEEIEAIQSDLETDITNLETYLATGEYAKPKVEETPIIEQPEVEEVVAEETTVKEEITVKEEPKPTPQKIKVLGKDVNMYNDYIPSKVEDVETDAMYSFNADSKDGIPTLLHDKAYTNTREVNGVKTENWHASISGEELLKLYPKEQSLKETPKAGSVGVGGDVGTRNSKGVSIKIENLATKESPFVNISISTPEQTGHASIRIKEDGKAYISDIQIGDFTDNSRGKGYGLEAYIQIAEHLDKLGYTLESTQWDKHNTAISPQALRVWEKMVSEGYAKVIGQKENKVYNRETGLEEVKITNVYEFVQSPQKQKAKVDEIHKKLDAITKNFVNNGKTQSEAERLALNAITEAERQVLRDAYNQDGKSLPTDVKGSKQVSESNPRAEGIVTPEGFTNRVFESNMQLGEAPNDAHISEQGYNYRVLSQNEIDAISESGGVFAREGKQKGGNKNTKYWTKGNNKNWYGDKDNLETIRVKQDNFKEDEVVRAENVEVYNKETKQFEPLIKEQSIKEAPKIEPPKFATEAKAEKRNIAFPSFIPTEQSTKKTNTEKLADMARSGKINKPGQFMSSTGFTVVWDAMLEAIAVTIETTGSVGNAIKKATQVMKDSDWFKNLAPNIQDEQVAQMELYLDDQIKKQYHDKIVEKETKEFNTPKGSSKPITEPSGITYVEASEDPNGEQKERQFVANTVGAVDERTTLQVMEQMYNTTTNIFQLDQAKRYINSFDSIEAAENALIKGQSNLPIDVQVVAMMEIVRQYNAMGKYEQAASMIDELAPLSTSLAKALQAHNLWRVMIEDMNSVLAYAQRQQSKNKKKAFEKDGVGTKTSKRIKKVAKQVGKQTVESKRVKAKIDSVSGKLSERLEKRKRDKFLNILDSIIIDTKNKSFDATIGIPIAIYNSAIKTIKAGYVAGLTILEAIELGIEKLGEYKESHGDKLREDILEKFGEDVEDSAPKKDKEKTKSKKSIVKQSAEDLGIKITDIITKHYDVQEQAKQSLKETLINEAGLNEQEAKELSDMVEEEFRVAAEKRLKSLEKKHKGTNFNYKKLVEAINVGEATSSSVDKAVTALLGLDALTAEEVKGIEDLTKAAQAAPAGFQRQEAITDLMRHIYTLKGASTKDILWALWYSSILSGFTTLLKNGLGNLANISLEGTVNTIFHLFSGALNLDPKRMMQAFAWVGDVSKGMGRGFIEAADILKEGYEPLKSIKHAEGLPSTSQDVLETWDHLFKLNPTKLARYVKRIMVATDAVAYYGLKNMAAKEFERKIRREYGIDKLERDALLTALDSNLKEADIEAIEQVKEEGLTGIKAKRRYYELIDAYREKYLPGITDISVKFASRGTYNYEPQGTLGEMSKLIIKAHQNENMFISSASKVLFPFVRIVANVTNQNLDYTPLGIKRAIFSGNKYYETVEEKQKAIAKVALGMAVFGGLLAAALRALDDDDENPWFMVTSDGYGNTKENQLLYANGWSPYTTTLFGVKFDYRYTPLAMIFTVMGHLIDAKKYKGEVDKDTWDRTTLILMRTGTALFDMSYLSGINSAVKLFEQGPMQEKNIANFFARTITSPIPNALRSIELLYNKDLYDNSTIEATILKNIPFVPGLRGPVRYNIFDEKIQVQGNFEKLIDKEETNELAKFLIKNHIKISGVSNKIANTKLTPEEYIELGRGIAKGLKLYLKENISWLKLETQEDIQNNINEEVERLKEEIKHDKFEKYYNAAVEGLE
jgi:hypothetical protein